MHKTSSNEYVKYFNDNKCVNLLVQDEELLKKCNEVWDKIINLLKKCLIVKNCTMINALKLR